jgi:hypothetical protein
MNFTLKKSGSTNMLTTFQVVDNAGDIRGTINVPLGAESDLTRHWTDETRNRRRPSRKSKARASRRPERKAPPGGGKASEGLSSKQESGKRGRKAAP